MPDAIVVVGCDASAVEHAASIALDAWRGAGSSIQASLGGLSRNFAEVALSAGRINFASQADQVRAFELATTRMAIAGGRDIESYQKSIEKTGRSILMQPAAVAAWEQGLSKLTYRFDEAGEGVKAIANLAAQTGRQTEDYAGLAVELGRVGIAGKDTAKMIGLIETQAKALKVQGGVAAFADQFERALPILSQFSAKTKEGAENAPRLLAMLGGMAQGRTPEQAKRAQQGVLGILTSHALGIERITGKKFTDEQGELTDPLAMARATADQMRKKWGKRAVRVAQLRFGAETGAALMGTDWAALEKQAALAGEAPRGRALSTLGQTPVGRRLQQEADVAAKSREHLGDTSVTGRIGNWIREQRAESPILTTFAEAISMKAGESLLRALVKKGGNIKLGGASTAAGETSIMESAALGGLMTGAKAGSGAAAGASKAIPVIGTILTLAGLAYDIRTKGVPDFAANQRAFGGDPSEFFKKPAPPTQEQNRALAQMIADAIKSSPIVVVDASNMPVNLVQKGKGKGAKNSGS